MSNSEGAIVSRVRELLDRVFDNDNIELEIPGETPTVCTTYFNIEELRGELREAGKYVEFRGKVWVYSTQKCDKQIGYLLLKTLGLDSGREEEFIHFSKVENIFQRGEYWEVSMDFDGRIVLKEETRLIKEVRI